MSDRVQLTIDSAVATVRMSRPEKRNALDADMFRGLIRTGERIIADNRIRAVVLHGEGKAFCAGLDFASFLGSPDSMQELLARSEESPANMAQRAAWIWQEVKVPVIAAVHGFAFGGGLQIALGADLRYVTADAQFSVMEIKWGLIPDMSITQTLLRLVPIDVAKEFSDDPLADAVETAKLIATKSPHAIRAGKALLRDAADALKLETALQVSLLGGPNQTEAVQANMMKRAPSFKDPE
ncbi:MAG: enoyl-CoA hydratase/isomerase family protein [Deltaproteobacteria bacterium]|nr:enoyl-CoA hydratase/isomerase family protein [Deltaproteobacteria bacterium]